MDKPRFKIGDYVRVRPGERCEATGDVAYGGWDGEAILVEEFEGGFEYQVRWSDETLDAADPIHEEIWWREMVDDDGLWFREDQLEPHAGDAPPRESLSEEFVREFEDRDSRIAAALGVEGPGAIPFPDEDYLDRYHRYLTERLEFPFEAQFEMLGHVDDEEEADRGDDLDEEAEVLVDEFAAADKVDDEWATHDVTVLGLIPLEDNDSCSYTGLLCRALEENRPQELALTDLKLKHEGPNRELVDDFRYWFDTWHRLDSASEEEGDAWDDDEDASWDDADQDRDEDEGFEVEDYLEQTAVTATEAQMPEPHAPITRDGPRVGRNDLCPCGSGRKFKKCCLNKPAPPSDPST